MFKSQTLVTIKDYLRQDHPDWQQVLEIIILNFDCTTGTIHFWDKRSNLLLLKASSGLPEFLIPKLQQIPTGKGMAGIAAERLQPVELCNLQTDKSGTARPAAKESKVEGSIAIPMIWNNILYGTLGIGKLIPHDFTEEEVNELLEIGTEISRAIASEIK